MKEHRHRITAFAALMIALAVAQAADATGEAGYSMEILANGRPMNELLAAGTTYVEAIKGREYSVRLTNHTGRRVAIALAIDGLNSIDAKTTTAEEAAKWVLGPYETITVDGWQTGADTARRFFFTTEASSYGAWLVRTAKLGVIEAVVFRERRPRSCFLKDGERERDSSRAAPSAPAPRQEAESKSRRSKEETAAEGLSDELAATGIGREVDNPVRRVEFVAERNASSTLRIRYEYHEQLVELGVIPAPHPTALERRERARGFTDMEFAPDPYRARR